MNYVATIGTDTYTVTVEEHNASTKVALNGSLVDIDLLPVDGDGLYSLLIGGRSYTAAVLDTEDRLQVKVDGAVYSIDIEQEDLVRLRQTVKRKTPAGGEQIKAPMPGRILSIDASVGDTVGPGQGIVVIEAMKMENELRTHTGGVVKEIRVQVGAAVNKNDVLVILAEPEAPPV